MKKYISFFIFILIYSLSFAQINSVQGLNADNLDVATNYIKNKSCLKNTNNISATGLTITSDSTNIDQGKSCKIVSTASGQFAKFQTFTIDNKLQGATGCQTSVTYQGSGAGSFKISLFVNSSKITQTDTVLSATTSPTTATIFHTCYTGPSNVVEAVVESTSAATIYIADVKTTRAQTSTTSISTPETLYTPTFVGMGTVSSIECFNSRLSDKLFLRCKGVVGTPTATTVTVSLPSNLTISSTVQTLSVLGKGNINAQSATYFSGFTVLGVAGSSNLNIGLESSTTNGLTAQQGSTVFSAGNAFSFTALIPISGWSAATTLVDSRCPNDIACENTFVAKISSSGTITDQNLPWLASCSFPSGSASCSFNSGVFTAAPTCLGALVNQPVNSGFINIGSISSSSFSASTVSNGAATSLAFNVVCIRNPSEFVAKKVIQGFLDPFRTEVLSFGGATEPSVCSSTPCTIYTNSNSFVSSVVRNGTGDYTITFSNGVFSTKPICNINLYGNSGSNMVTPIMNPQSNTRLDILQRNTSATSADFAYQVICRGLR